MGDGMGDIFGAVAPGLWDAGVSVLPLIGKRPVVSAWTTWANELPDEDTRAAWLSQYSRNNVGVACGRQSGLVGVDIDTDDPRVIGAIERILPVSGYERWGRKGKLLVFAYSGELSFTLKDADGNQIMDFLSSGRQFVIPPSIHPDTGAAYRSSCDLEAWVRRGGIPVLPRGWESLLRETLADVGVRTSAVTQKASALRYVASGGRDNMLVRLAGTAAWEILRGSCTFFEAMGHLVTWVEERTEKVAGDDVTTHKAVEKLAEMLRRDVLAKNKALPDGWDEGLSEELKKDLGLDEIGRQHRKLPPNEIEAEFLREIAVDNNSPIVMRALETALARIAMNDDMVEMEQTRLLRLLVEGSGRRVTLSDVRKRLKSLQGGDREGNSHEEIAAMALEDLEQRGEFRFDIGNFWEWHGTHWQKVGREWLENFVSENYGRLPAAKRKSDHVGIVKVLQGKCEKALCLTKVPGINFANGYLTQDLELLPHDKNFGCVYVHPYIYNPEENGHCVKWLEMLQSYWGQESDYEQRVECLQQAMAATLFGVAATYHRAFLFYGEPGSGKSTIMDVVRGLMPPGTCCEVRPEVFGERFELVAMAGKLMNHVAEMKDTKRIDGALFKQVVEGAPIGVEFKGKDKFTLEPKCAHWFGTNKLPKVDSPDGGYDRRWVIFEFHKKIEEGVRIPRYAELIVELEAPAIIAWAVQGIRGLRAMKGYVMPPSSQRAVNEMARSADSVRFYFDRCLEEGHLLVGAAVGTNTFTLVDTLYSDYRHFCRNRAFVSPVNLREFTERFRWRGSQEGIREKVVGETGEIVGFTSITLAVKKVA